MHIDTMWKFSEMIEFRDKVAKESGMELITYTNPDGLKMNINPFELSEHNLQRITRHPRKCQKTARKFRLKLQRSENWLC